MPPYQTPIDGSMTFPSYQEQSQNFTPAQQRKPSIGDYVQQIAPSIAGQVVKDGAGSLMSNVLGTGASTASSSGFGPVGTMIDGSTMMGSSALPGAATTAASPWSLGGIGAGGNYLAPIAGLYGLGDLAFNRESSDIKAGLQGAASGAAVGSYFGPPGMLIGGIGGGLYGLATSAFGSGKDVDQKERDKIKANLQRNGFVTDKWGFRTPYGEYELRDNPEFFTPDPKYGHAQDVKNMTDPFGFILSGGNQKHAGAYSGWLANSALQNSTNLNDARANLLYTIRTFNISPSQAREAINQGMSSGAITPEQGSQYLDGINNLVKKKK